LAEENIKDLFPWLLAGTSEEVRKIHDTTGVCPKLLHIYSQITHLAALLVFKVLAAREPMNMRPFTY
jgi:hypothetical protein